MVTFFRHPGGSGAPPSSTSAADAARTSPDPWGRPAMSTTEIAASGRTALRHGPDPEVRSAEMPRKPTGEVLERRRGATVIYALRFRAYGQRRYLTLGTKAEGWTRARAEEELQNVLADVRR